MSPIVEEQGAAVGLLDLAHRAFLARAGEGPAGIAEELGLDEGFGNGRAVEGHEGPGCPRPAVVEGLGKHFLACAGLTLDEDRDIAAENAGALVDGGLQTFVTGGQGLQREPLFGRCRTRRCRHGRNGVLTGTAGHAFALGIQQCLGTDTMEPKLPRRRA
jgi:hypothetical protein